MSQIVITEKASQAKNVRDAVGSRYGPVMPAQGHLVELMEPGDVKDEWRRWSTALLRPDGLYGLKPARDKRRADILAGIKRALKRTEKVWIATDCDREGQLIGQEILEYCKFRGEVMRVIFAAEDPETIAEAFACAEPNETYRSLYEAGVARQQADQIYNLSLTRAATVTLGAEGSGAVGVGRVKTPTLAIAVRRELEIRHFVPKAYYEVEADTQAAQGAFKMLHAPKERITERAAADAVAEKANGFAGPLSVTVADKRERPPQLHSLPSLQKACAQKFGWTAKKTGEIAQELYAGEGKKITTYPRTEVRHLPANATQFVAPIVEGLRRIEDYAALPAPEPPTIRTGGKGTFSDKGLGKPGEGEPHHAIVPNVKTIGQAAEVWARLGEDERKAFDLIARSYLAAVMPDHEYKQTTLVLDVEGHAFRASGRQTVRAGWREIYGAEDPEGGEASAQGDKQKLPRVADGERVQVTQARTVGKETKPPPRYNEGTLIDAMKQAWRYVEDEAERETLKETEGIGTAHTRSEILEGLKRQGFLESKGKQVRPTESGIQLHQVLEKADPEVVDPGTTARFERTLGGVVDGSVAMEAAIDAVSESAGRIIERIAKSDARVKTTGGGATRAPSAAMKKLAKALAERKKIALPKGALSSSAVCRAFLDEHAGGGNGGPPASERPPSERQTAYAESIAKQIGQAVPESARANAAAMSQWLDEQRGKRPPSEKQVEFAKAIASRKNTQIPAKAMRSGPALSKWIEANR